MHVEAWSGICGRHLRFGGQRLRSSSHHVHRNIHRFDSVHDHFYRKVMAENVPPSSTQPVSASVDQPGRPYYESLRATLRQTLEKKRKLDDQLAALEEQIYKTEGTYLEETANSGNIVRGFDGWVKGVQVGERAADDRRRGRVREEDRVFSRSSMNWTKVSWFVCHFRMR